MIGCPISTPSLRVAFVLNQGPFPPPALPGFPGTTGLSATPSRPEHLSQVSGCSSLSTPRGFPCCVRFPCVHAVATTPARRLRLLPCSFSQPYQPSPVWQPGRPVHRPFRGLLSVHSRYGLHTRAVTVFRDTLNRRLQPFRYLHSCSGCFRLEQFAGWAFHPLESAAFARRTPRADTWLALPKADIGRQQLSGILKLLY